MRLSPLDKPSSWHPWQSTPAFGRPQVANNSLPRSAQWYRTQGTYLQNGQVVAPEKYRRFLSYVIGWCVLVGEVSWIVLQSPNPPHIPRTTIWKVICTHTFSFQISTSSSCALNSAEIVAALVEITHPEISWKVSAGSAVPSGVWTRD